MSLEDYVEFIKGTSWNTYNKKGRRQLFGNCMREGNPNGGN
jgi:hypothetical protein